MHIVLLILISTAPPPQPPNSLHINSSSNATNSVMLMINFDTSFSTDNTVEKYCIRSQSSRGVPGDTCVPVGSNYTSDELEAGGEYNFTVRAVNCVDQESNETEVITITPQSKSVVTGAGSPAKTLIFMSSPNLAVLRVFLITPKQHVVEFISAMPI